jgi:hypothetical protein
MSAGESIYLGLIAALMLCAVALFWRVQVYLADPMRHERNEQWFAKFEQYMRQRYRDRDLHWRTHILEAQFHDPKSSGRAS